ncbi:hypothetical protein BM1_00667 [Bipolaris maydis]|nr:hypothetical protein BM1_00667 [Bipolaris maydis]
MSGRASESSRADELAEYEYPRVMLYPVDRNQDRGQIVKGSLAQIRQVTQGLDSAVGPQTHAEVSIDVYPVCQLLHRNVGG